MKYITLTIIAVLIFACSDGDTGPTPNPNEGQNGDNPISTVGQSLYFGYNLPESHDYALQTAIPQGFGVGEFTLEMWLKLDNTFPIGPATRDATNDAGEYLQLLHWYDGDPNMQASNWWYRGNFLLDGHNNNGGFDQGTFSIQFYNAGCVRWMLGDGNVPRAGGVWGAQAPSGSQCSLLDGQWHHLAFVRRFVNNASELQIWVDGKLINAYDPQNPDVEGPVRTIDQTDMYNQYWNTWGQFSAHEAGWFWGSEKQAAIGTQTVPGYGLSYYEDYKGLIDEVRFWNGAKSFTPSNYDLSVTGNEPGLLAWFDFSKVESGKICDVIAEGTPQESCWVLKRMNETAIRQENAPTR